MSIQRRNHGKGHTYINTDTGARVPGVSTIIGDGIPKKALINWAANATAEYAVDHWDNLTDLPPSARMKELQGARYAVSDAAANKGTQVHKLAERLVHGDKVAVPAGLEGHVESYVAFLDEFDVQPILVERTVWSPEHNYCGTFDLIAQLLDPDDPEPDETLRERNTWLLDIKTNRSGIFGETALQLAAYRYAELVIGEGGEEDGPLPLIDLTGAVHVRADGYDLIPVDAGQEQFRAFLYAMQVGQFVNTSRDLVGEAIISPTTSIYRLTTDGGLF
jgi:hypothetical protein